MSIICVELPAWNRAVHVFDKSAAAEKMLQTYAPIHLFKSLRPYIVRTYYEYRMLYIKSCPCGGRAAARRTGIAAAAGDCAPLRNIKTTVLAQSAYIFGARAYKREIAEIRERKKGSILYSEHTQMLVGREPPRRTDRGEPTLRTARTHARRRHSLSM